MFRLLIRLASFIIFAVGSAFSASAQSYLDEIARTPDWVLEGQGIRLNAISIGDEVLGRHKLTAKLHNLENKPRDIMIRVASFQGLTAEALENTYAFRLSPGEIKDISADYEFHTLTPFSRIIVYGYSVEDQNAEPVRLFARSIFLGWGNPQVGLDFDGLVRASGSHIDAYAIEDSLAQNDIRKILRIREDTITRILEILGVNFDGRIKLFLYPDEDIKRAHTGHSGLGWAMGDFIAEVYNEDEQLDPYHELAHILAGKLGKPPALMDEGFATYISESFGSDALEYLGAPGETVDAVAARYAKLGQLFPLEELMAVENIGSTPERGQIEYPQAASFVKFLIEVKGFANFRQLYSSLRLGADTETRKHNRTILEQVLGKSLEEIEAEWLAKLPVD